MLYVTGRRAEDVRLLGERLPPPLMYMAGAGGLAGGQITRAELAALGFRLIVDPTTPFLVMHNALRHCYAALAADKSDPLLGGEAGQEQAIVHQTIDLEAMLEIERQTVEK
jgi:2-methylisocitrate lyase-like PEP mutase family enzyme